VVGNGEGEVDLVFEEPSPSSEGLYCVELVNFVN
jgi:hypothetical protein